MSNPKKIRNIYTGEIAFIFILWIAVSCNPAKKYVESSAKWEKEINALVLKDSENIYPGNSILFLGSSSIRLWDNIAEDMTPYPVIQRGFGGANLSDLLVYVPRLADPHQVRAIGIFVANDIYGGDKDREPEEVLKLYKKVVKSLQKNHKNTPVFFIEITPTASRWSVWPETQKANQLIKTYSEKTKNLYFIETAAYFLGADGKPIDEYFRSDRLHLTQKGYDLWSEIIKSALNKNLK